MQDICSYFLETAVARCLGTTKHTGNIYGHRTSNLFELPRFVSPQERNITNLQGEVSSQLDLLDAMMDAVRALHAQVGKEPEQAQNDVASTAASIEVPSETRNDVVPMASSGLHE